MNHYKAKYIFAFLIVLVAILGVASVLFIFLSPKIAKADYVPPHVAGQWDEWWNIGEKFKIRRIYDNENKLVCWVVINSYVANTSPAISCNPSLELK